MKKQYALNRLFNFSIIVGTFWIWMSILLLQEGDTEFGGVLCILSLLVIVFFAIFTPYCYAFDSEGVSLCYIFLPVERYLWSDIRAIKVEWKHFGPSTVLDLFFDTVFSIDGINVGPHRFYMDGHIRKSFRTKYLLEKYWDGEITGYMFEGFQKWKRERKRQKQADAQMYLTAEVIPMEQEARELTREWIKPYVTQAEQHNLYIKTNYYFVTKDFEELNARPKEGYTYTLVAEIALFHEKDEDRIVVLSIDLVYVRLGKTAYRGVKNSALQEEFEFTFSDTLNEIYKNGIEAYCEEL